MYKACIFDLDGTLTDTLESLTYSVNETLKELALPPITMEQCRQFVGNGAKVLIENALRASGDEELHLLDKGMETYARVFSENCTYHVKPYDGILEMMDQLKLRGVKAAVLSNKPHNQTLDVVDTFLGKERVEFANGQREGIPRKPDPAGVFELMNQMGVSKEETLYIGDSDVDMVTGTRAELVTVGVTWGFRSREVLEESGADHIIDKPEQLLELL